MSRKYCAVCGEAHKNPQDGLCDNHLEQQEAARITEHNNTADEWNAFMELSEECRWEKVFDFMRANGFKVHG